MYCTTYCFALVTKIHLQNSSNLIRYCQNIFSLLCGRFFLIVSKMFCALILYSQLVKTTGTIGTIMYTIIVHV